MDSPLNEKSYYICSYRQRQCDDFNFVSFCISDKFFSAMIVRPGTVHSEILNANMGFQIDSRKIAFSATPGVIGYACFCQVTKPRFVASYIA